MLIFGINKSKLGAENLQLNCIHCQSKFSVDAEIYGRYFHLFFLPVFPVGKEVVTVCSHCKHKLEKDQAHATYGNELHLIKKNFKAPLWHFGWLFVWLIATPIVAYIDIKGKEKDATYIDSPLAGDIYEIDNGLWSYTLYKVSKATKDSVYFFPNLFEVNKKRKLDDEKMLNERSFDHDNVIVFSKAELKKMREKKEVIGINRPD